MPGFVFPAVAFSKSQLMEKENQQVDKSQRDHSGYETARLVPSLLVDSKRLTDSDKKSVIDPVEAERLKKED